MWVQAREFLAAATREFDLTDGRVSFPAYFLAARSIELGLKSFLLMQGQDERRLRSISHDLVHAVEEAKSAGIVSVVPLRKEDEAVIAWINGYYQSKHLEYPKTGLMSFPDDRTLLSTAVRIVEGLEPVVRQWRPR